MFGRAIDGATEAGAAVAPFLAIALAVLNVYEVIVRYLFSSPTSWSGQYSAYLVLGIVMAYAPKLTRERAHISVDFMREVAPPAVRERIQTTTMLVCSATCVLGAAIVAFSASQQFSTNLVMSSTTEFPKWLLSAGMVYGLLFTGIEFIRSIGKVGTHRGNQTTHEDASL